MASSSRRRSGSSGRNGKRKRVVITPERSRDGGPRPVEAAKKSQPQHKADSSARSKGSTGAKKRAQRTQGGPSRGRASDAKRLARESRLAQARRRVRRRVAAAVLGVVLLLAGSVTLYRSSVFAIERIDVAGNARLTDEQVRSLAAVPPGSTLLRYPRTEIEERILENAWIAEVQVSRDFPDGVRIRVVERKPVLLVDVGDSLFWLVDAEGVILGQRPPDPADTMIVVRDLVDFEPIEGEVTDSAELANALAVVDGLSDELRAGVRAISAESVDLTTLITREDVEILVGSVEDIERKSVIALSILEEQAGRAVYINVRTPGRPTWRGLDAP